MSYFLISCQQNSGDTIPIRVTTNQVLGSQNAWLRVHVLSPRRELEPTLLACFNYERAALISQGHPGLEETTP